MELQDGIGGWGFGGHEPRWKKINRGRKALRGSRVDNRIWSNGIARTFQTHKQTLNTKKKHTGQNGKKKRKGNQKNPQQILLPVKKKKKKNINQKNKHTHKKTSVQGKTHKWATIRGEENKKKRRTRHARKEAKESCVTCHTDIKAREGATTGAAECFLGEKVSTKAEAGEKGLSE